MLYLINMLKILIKCDNTPKKVQPQLKTMIFDNIGTFNTDGAEPYKVCIYRYKNWVNDQVNIMKI